MRPRRRGKMVSSKPPVQKLNWLIKEPPGRGEWRQVAREKEKRREEIISRIEKGWRDGSARKIGRRVRLFRAMSYCARGPSGADPRRATLHPLEWAVNKK